MRRAFCLLACLATIFFNMTGCQNSTEEIIVNSTKDKIQNTTKIQMGYGFNNYTAEITNQESIKQLEDLFNGAEFNKTEKPKKQTQLQISFYGKNGTTHFYIDQQDYIRLEDNSYVKSDKINFEKIIYLYKDELAKSSKEREFLTMKKTENLLGKRIENSLGVTIYHGAYSNSIHIIEQEEIEELEDLFSEAELYKYDKDRNRGQLRMNFYGKNGITRLYIDEQDYIKTNDGMYVKSREIEFEKLFSLYKEKMEKSTEMISAESFEGKKENPPKGKIDNTSEIVIGYSYSHAMHIISDQEKIKEIEDLFNGAEFSECIIPIKHPFLHITFYGQKSITRFFIDDNNVIRLADGRHVKSNQLNYDNIMTIYSAYKKSLLTK